MKITTFGKFTCERDTDGTLVFDFSGFEFDLQGRSFTDRPETCLAAVRAVCDQILQTAILTFQPVGGTDANLTLELPKRPSDSLMKGRL